MHISIPNNVHMEFIEATEVSPLISKCQIKVCYVGNEPNRNGSVITKEVAREMGKTLPGCPIVGFYNKKTKDFEGHNRTVELTEDGELDIVDVTKPYGFVDTNAKVWFQEFLDDDGVNREYLCTEGYLWTEAYPDAKRIIEHGNNQSMEINEKTLQGNWTKVKNGYMEFFIINEALIEKLCILGENVEPCFEGAQVKSKFELDGFEEFKNTMFSMINEIKQALHEGGSSEMNTENTELEFNEKNSEFEDKNTQETFKKTDKDTEEENKENKTADEGNENKDEEEDKKKKVTENKCNEDEEEDKKKTEHAKAKDEDEEEDKKKYNLEEIEEYVSLKADYDDLNTKFAALTAEIESLRAFKLEADRKDKQALIDTFAMLTDEEKSDVVNNIDTYSLSDIESKLSILCVRNNKLNFNLNETATAGMSFNLNTAESNVPAWVKAVKDVASARD